MSFYFTPGDVRSIAISVSVYVCLSGRIPQKPYGQTSRKFCRPIYVTYSRGSVLLWWQCNMLCTFGFVDSIMFSHSRADRAELSASTPPLSALPPADWYPAAVSIAVHNEVHGCGGEQCVAHRRRSLLSSTVLLWIRRSMAFGEWWVNLFFYCSKTWYGFAIKIL